MAKDAIKTEINKVLDVLPEKALEDLLSFLKSIGANKTTSILDQSNLERILNEDKGLLAKLAK